MSFYGQRIYEVASLLEKAIVQGSINNEKTIFTDLNNNQYSQSIGQMPSKNSLYVDNTTLIAYLWIDNEFKAIIDNTDTSGQLKGEDILNNGCVNLKYI